MQCSTEQSRTLLQTAGVQSDHRRITQEPDSPDSHPDMARRASRHVEKEVAEGKEMGGEGLREGEGEGKETHLPCGKKEFKSTGGVPPGSQKAVKLIQAERHCSCLKRSRLHTSNVIYKKKDVQYVCIYIYINQRADGHLRMTPNIR